MRSPNPAAHRRLTRFVLASAVAALALGALFGAARSFANPMLDTMFFATQVPGTHHVQLTYLNDMEKVPTVGFYLRDDKAWELKWKVYDGYKADTGSGGRVNKVVQACDCNVSLGKHVFRVMPGGRAYAAPLMMRAAFEVVADKPDPAKVPPKPRPAPKNDLERVTQMLEDDYAKRGVPIPKGVQGLDCRAECTATSTAPEAATQPKDTAVQRKATVTTGWLVLDGRLVRPPYKLVLDNYRLEVNGQPVQTFDRFAERRMMLDAFNSLTSSLRYNRFLMRCGGRESSRPASAKQTKAWFKQLDDITHGTQDRNAKVQAVSGVGKAVFSGCAEKIVDHWDGAR